MVLNSWKLTIPILLTIDDLFAVELRRRLFVRSDTSQCQQWPDFHFCGVPGFLYCEGLRILLYPECSGLQISIVNAALWCQHLQQKLDLPKVPHPSHALDSLFMLITVSL